MKLLFKNPLLLFSISFFLLLILPRLLSHGMFFDGVTYASIARNLAIGAGSFWKLHYTDVVFPICYEHTPLGFWLQSLAFRLFGDSVRIEAFYGLFMGILTVLIACIFWRILFPDKARQAWFPILLFSVFPITSWIYANNLLENTMTIFTTFAALAGYMSAKSNQWFKRIFWGLLSAMAIISAFLTKGPVGLFPMVVPIVAMIFISEIPFRNGIVAFAYVALFSALIFVLIFSQKEAYEFLKIYLGKQVMASVQGTREHVSSHFFILKRLFLECIVPIMTAGALQFIFRKSAKVNFSRKFLFLLSIAIAGSFPLIVSYKQQWWYMFPSLPFYAMVFSALFIEAGENLENRIIHNRTMKSALIAVSLLMFVGANIAMIADRDTIRKEAKFHGDFTVQKLQISFGQRISVCPASLETDWPLVANMARQFGASLTKEQGCEYLLVAKDLQCPIPDYCRKIHPSEARNFILYKCKSGK